MTTTIINKDTYFRQNIYVTTINIGSKPFLNIPNMRVVGDVSMNSITIGALTTAALNVQNNTTLNFNYNVVNNSTKSATSIGYTNIVTSATTININSLNVSSIRITQSNIPAGVYIFDYSYNIIYNGTNLVIHQLYDYINNTTTNTNIYRQNNTFTFTSATQPYSGNNYNTTFGVLTSALNTITFVVGEVVSSGTSSNTTLNNFYLRYTRIA
jgi:hypothetical protein